MFKKLKHLLQKDKTKQQIYKLIVTLTVCIGLLLVVEWLFQIPAISDAFGEDAFDNRVGIGVWIILWLLMFAQVTIIPVPAMPIYVFCNGYNGIIANGSELKDLLSWQTVFFLLYTTSACIVGALCAYGLGKLCGKKALKWIAGDEEEYNVWCKNLNCKMGKWIYAATIMLPIFPDDIICIVAGAIRLDFKFFVMANIIGKIVGATCLCVFMRLPLISDFLMSSLDGGFPWALFIYSILFISSIVAAIYWKRKVLSKSCISNVDNNR